MIARSVAWAGAAAVAALIAFGGAASAQAQTPPRVRVVYLIPEDRPLVAAYEKALRSAIESLRMWFGNETGGPTFALSDPVVDVVRTPNTASWYAEHPADPDPSLWFFRNVTHEAFALLGASFDDPENVWLLYVDADPACGQRVGGTSHVAVLPANDLRGLAGRAQVATCPGEAIEQAPVPRWIGGMGHELGHALGLSHPPGCDEGAPGCQDRALMFYGYLRYPSTFLLPAEVAALRASPFLAGDPCAPASLAPDTLEVSGSGGPVRVDVTVPGDCTWTAVSHVPWIAVGNGTRATGPRRLRLTVAPNATDQPRAGIVVVAGQRLEISQPGMAATADMLPVGILVTPGQDGDATVSWAGRGRIQVAVLSTAEFSAPTDVVQASLGFGPLGTELTASRCGSRDADGDGVADLVCTFKNGSSVFATGDVVGVLTGVTTGGQPIVGLGLVRLRP